MQTRFLLGPAGTGKTFRCLEEIRDALKTSFPNQQDAPLILLVPKQATFQLERQLFADDSLAGYTQLQILHFEKLADFVLKQLRKRRSEILSDEGRTMVLRALLIQNRDQLKIFRASARMPGFAQQLSIVLRDLQRHQLSPSALFKLAEKIDTKNQLKAKLHDLALLSNCYFDWLKNHELHDTNSLLDIATECLRSEKSASAFRIGRLWLDGFAEMTPQELDFLSALVPFCEDATLAFCIDPEIKNPSALSIWSLVNRTFENCRARLQAIPDRVVEMEILQRTPANNRFSESAILRHLEENWASPKEFQSDEPLDSALRFAECANPEGEAILAAHEILRFARGGGRFREAAVLLRSFEGYHDVLRRVFSRYEIPFFLDRRESIAHHPLAELTRSVLRMAAFDWGHDDFFCALKTGLVTSDQNRVDHLENEALGHGWKNDAWLQPLKFTGEKGSVQHLEEFRKQIIPPFNTFRENVFSKTKSPTGIDLAAAIRRFWKDLNVEEQLQKWAEKNPIHITVLQQMESWLENIERAFPTESLRVSDWLPICEAGLGAMTAGAIPPALDQVLIGTIDRSRNPDLDLTLVLGLNESVFPAAPKSGNLLTENDQSELSKLGVFVGPNKMELLGRERFYGYIACTRSRRRLVLARATHDNEGRELNRSPFFSTCERLFPTVRVEQFFPIGEWFDAEHRCELMAPLIHSQLNAGDAMRGIAQSPMLELLRAQIEHLIPNPDAEVLSPESAEKLYGATLETSVSALEKFAACPMQFFISAGLRAEERRVFELDVRERGKFQHEILEVFHKELRAEKKRWRDISPENAREKIAKIGRELKSNFRDGLLDSEAQNEFQAESMIRSLQEFIVTAIGWMQQYEFDPEAVELRFGLPEANLPAWEIEIDGKHKLAFRGTMDRVDLHRMPGSNEALAVVIDYKSSAKKIDAVLLKNGVQLQLPAYLAFLRQLADPGKIFSINKIIPAGVFYVNLRGEFRGGKTRHEILDNLDASRQQAYRHTGRFDFCALKFLDNRGENHGTQFNYRLRNDGQPYGNSNEVLSSATFDQMLDGIERILRDMGQRIFAGETQIDPYQKGNLRACDHCEYESICRIDAWNHNFRVLKKQSSE